MLDKDPALKNLLRNANLDCDLPCVLLKRKAEISVGKDVVNILDHEVFYLFTTPPYECSIERTILFLHDQTNTSSVWSKIGSLQTFAALGYRCIAPDLPSVGRTGGAAIEDDVRAIFINLFVSALNIKEVIVVGSSMAGKYVVPLLGQKSPRQKSFYLSCIIAVALSDTNKLMTQSTTSVYDIMTPCLVLRGALDTSLGLNAADVLSRLPNSRVVVVPAGKHLCHQSDPDYFHKVMFNFLEILVRNVTKKSIFVTEL